jgi:hypothetical protein
MCAQGRLACDADCGLIAGWGWFSSTTFSKATHLSRPRGQQLQHRSCCCQLQQGGQEGQGASPPLALLDVGSVNKPLQPAENVWWHLQGGRHGSTGELRGLPSTAQHGTARRSTRLRCIGGRQLHQGCYHLSGLQVQQSSLEAALNPPFPTEFLNS